MLPEDIRWLLELTGPRVHQLNAYYARQGGLDDEALLNGQRAVPDAAVKLGYVFKYPALAEALRSLHL